MMHTDAELAYLAGIIDGEGHVCVTNANGIAIILCMADVQILYWCLEHFGGSLSGRWKAEGSKSRPRRIWSLNRKRGLETVARELLPFLVLKRAEVAILLEAIEQRRGPPRRGSPGFLAWQEQRDALIVRAHDAMLARKQPVMG